MRQGVLEFIGKVVANATISASMRFMQSWTSLYAKRVLDVEMLGHWGLPKAMRHVRSLEAC